MIICKSMNLDHLAGRMQSSDPVADAKIAHAIKLDCLVVRLSQNNSFSSTEAEKMRDLLVDYAEDNPGVTHTNDLTESQWLELLEKAVA